MPSFLSGKLIAVTMCPGFSALQLWVVTQKTVSVLPPLPMGLFPLTIALSAVDKCLRLHLALAQGHNGAWKTMMQRGVEGSMEVLCHSAWAWFVGLTPKHSNQCLTWGF